MKLEDEDLVKNILVNAKSDVNFFSELMNFFERNHYKREILLAILRRILLDESKKIFKE